MKLKVKDITVKQGKLKYNKKGCKKQLNKEQRNHLASGSFDFEIKKGMSPCDVRNMRDETLLDMDYFLNKDDLFDENLFDDDLGSDGFLY